jgi:phosphoribosylformylglycinamidine cyclo-ligase
VFDLVARLGRVPDADLERTLNMGVGMVAVVAGDSADRAVARLAERGLPAWVLGEVRVAPEGPAGTGPDVVRGTKGVDAGSVRMVGTHPR